MCINTCICSDGIETEAAQEWHIKPLKLVGIP